MDKKSFVEFLNENLTEEKGVETYELQSIEEVYEWIPVLEDGVLNNDNPEMFVVKLDELICIKGNVDTDEEDYFYLNSNNIESEIEKFEVEKYLYELDKLRNKETSLFSNKKVELNLENLVKHLLENLGGDNELITEEILSIPGIEFSYIPNITKYGSLDSKNTVIALFKTTDGIYALDGVLREYPGFKEALYRESEEIEDDIYRFSLEDYLNNIKKLKSSIFNLMNI